VRRYYIGTQGWNYDFWSGVFYPERTRAVDRLELYSRVFNCVEIDSTFYAMPPAERFSSWYERTPPGFTFTVKLPRDITHDARLDRAERLLEEFCDRAALLRDKLGPLLFQLPADFTIRERVTAERFLRALPREFRFAIEFRDAAWFDERTFDVLRETNTTLAVSVGPWLSTKQAMAIEHHAPGEFRYLRWLGSPRHQELTAPLVRERERDLQEWADMLESQPPLDLFAFFNNDYQGHSPESARRLQQLLGLEPANPAILREQGDLWEIG
jgi:uncharacterized protein YecE (DUF72 family)